MKTLNFSLLIASLLLVPACDLPDKQLGDETETTDSSADTDDGNDGQCEPGDTMQPDSCNSCSCNEGQWVCTEVDCLDEPFDACDGTEQQPDYCAPGCVPGDLEFASGCNLCECQSDQTWACEATELTTDELGCGCSCDAEGWACNEGGCQGDTNPFDGDELAYCDDDVPHKELFVSDVSIEGDVLRVEVQYGGGCEPHFFGGCWGGGFDESAPVQVGLSIAHAGPQDFCEAAPSELVEIDLITLRTQYEINYQTSTGVIDISLDGWNEVIQYSF